MQQAALRQKILDWAERDPNVRLVVETGAFTREKHPADALSDLDIELYARDVALLLRSREWIEDFAPVALCLELENDGFNPTRLVIFQDGTKVDFAIYEAALLAQGFRSQAQQRGWVVHLDKDGATKNWQRLSVERPLPSQAEFENVVEEFWFEVYHVAKYLKRNDVWHAKLRDFATKEFLLQMLEWHSLAFESGDVWHLGHFLTDWTEDATQHELKSLWSGYERAPSEAALTATYQLFARLAREVAEKWDLIYPKHTENNILAIIREWNQ